jgi:hypothetical protein
MRERFRVGVGATWRTLSVIFAVFWSVIRVAWLDEV